MAKDNYAEIHVHIPSKLKKELETWCEKNNATHREAVEIAISNLVKDMKSP